MSLVVFDMDGTLIDSGAEITARVLKAFASVGLAAPSEQVIRANVGLSLPIYLSAVSGSDEAGLSLGCTTRVCEPTPSHFWPAARTLSGVAAIRVSSSSR